MDDWGFKCRTKDLRPGDPWAVSGAHVGTANASAGSNSCAGAHLMQKHRVRWDTTRFALKTFAHRPKVICRCERPMASKMMFFCLENSVTSQHGPFQITKKQLKSGSRVASPGSSG